VRFIAYNHMSGCIIHSWFRSSQLSTSWTMGNRPYKFTAVNDGYVSMRHLGKSGSLRHTDDVLIGAEVCSFNYNALTLKPCVAIRSKLAKSR
jgi:hypothetical protein